MGAGALTPTEIPAEVGGSPLDDAPAEAEMLAGSAAPVDTDAAGPAGAADAEAATWTAGGAGAGGAGAGAATAGAVTFVWTLMPPDETPALTAAPGEAATVTCAEGPKGTGAVPSASACRSPTLDIARPVERSAQIPARTRVL
jgi:hypothetical protein